ncbi:MAG: protein phosphatase 2C family protein [Bacteroidales bacterium]|nr:protein phosphatase 2C family protein [Bacteroidales bacterium]
MNQLCSKPKGHPDRMEDAYCITSSYIAVFDGATPKTAFRFADGRTPGQVAAQTLAQTTALLSPQLSAREAVDQLSDALKQTLQGHGGEASGVIYNVTRREVWSVGDCQYAFLHQDGRFESFQEHKLIDIVLSEWRSSILKSLLSRGVLTISDIQQHDPGRQIIQPFISRQTLYQNISPQTSKWAFGVFDGQHIPDAFIHITSIPDTVTDIILASDGYPLLFPTLEETEAHLAHLIQEDPLCIGPLLGTKGIMTGNTAPDDRTYIGLSPALPMREGEIIF